MHTYLLSTSSRLHIYFGLEDQRCDDIHLWPNMYDHDNIFDLSSFPKNSKYITVLASTTVALIFTILFTPFTIIYPHLLFTPIYYLPPFTIYPHFSGVTLPVCAPPPRWKFAPPLLVPSLKLNKLDDLRGYAGNISKKCVSRTKCAALLVL